MGIPTTLLGYLLYLIISLVAGRPQYNYQAASGGHSTSNLALNSGGSSSFSQGLVETSSRGISNSIGPLQIVQSNPISQAYLPPLSSGQQAFTDVSQLPLQTQSAASLLSNAPAYLSQSQNVIGHANSFSQQLIHPQQQTIVTKDIFIHAAPPDADEVVPIHTQLRSIPIRKNYRIIFIKAPTQNIRVAAEALRQAQAVSEERTIIYVLTKKPDVAELQKQLSQVQSTQQNVKSKPEVFFIKYKTNEEAQRAQQAIQAQYDALGGSTNISDEGIAPVSSVIGALDQNPLTYLPPGKK